MSSHKYYQEVDNIRFFSMFAIVAMHSYICGNFDFQGSHIIIPFLIQFFKYGTICFYLISGYLLGDRIFTESRWTYFKRRLKTLGYPFIFWSLLQFAQALILSKIKGSAITPLSCISTLFSSVFSTPLWFIPIFLFSLGIILIFRDLLHSPYFIAAVTLLPLFYSINLYLRIIPTQHNFAVFGYIFFIWIGIQSNKHRDKILALIQKIPSLLFLVVLLIEITLAVFESKSLTRTTNDILNTLRITNIIYSLTFFFFIMKFQRKIVPGFLSVRKTTFGIYLLHSFLFLPGVSLIKTFVAMFTQTPRDPFFFVKLSTESDGIKLFYWLILFVFVYTFSWLISLAIGKTKFAWIIGNPRKVLENERQA